MITILLVKFKAWFFYKNSYAIFAACKTIMQQYINSSRILLHIVDVNMIIVVWSNIFYTVFVPAGVILLWITAGRRFRQWIDDYRSREAINEIREQLTEMRERHVNTEQTNSSDSDSARQTTPTSDNTCVICLTNSRDIANRPCGHVCSCINCYEAMPGPKQCPVCRTPITEIIPIFLPWTVKFIASCQIIPISCGATNPSSRVQQLLLSSQQPVNYSPTPGQFTF